MQMTEDLDNREGASPKIFLVQRVSGVSWSIKGQHVDPFFCKRKDRADSTQSGRRIRGVEHSGVRGSSMPIGALSETRSYM